MINLATASTLTGWSKRTLWRRISDGTLKRTDNDGVMDDKKTKVDLDTIKPHICVPMEAGDLDLIEKADGGSAEAQTDLALLFLSHARLESAVFWLELAAKQNHANAMYLLGRCYIEGTGLLKDENIGIMYIAKAANLGHVISQGLMQAVLDKVAVKPDNS